MIEAETLDQLETRVQAADKRYGPFASTHEALGVCCEEWDEFRAAVQKNAFGSVQMEALDLAAALIRLHDQIENNDGTLKARSVK